MSSIASDPNNGVASGQPGREEVAPCVNIGHAVAAPVFNPQPPRPVRESAWPASVRLRDSKAGGPLRLFALPPLPNATAGDEQAHLQRTRLLNAMTGTRQAVAFGDDGTVSLTSTKGQESFQVTLRLEQDHVVDIAVHGPEDTATLSNLALRAARATRLLACMDRLLQLPRGRLDDQLKVMACVLDEAARTLAARGIDPLSDPRVDEVLDEVMNQALVVLGRRVVLAPVLARLRSHFQPQAGAAFAVLRDRFEAVAELRSIEPLHRWRLFVDPAIVEAVAAAGLDAGSPMMLFLLDASQSAYALRYAEGLCEALAHKDQALDLARLQSIARTTCDQHELALEVDSSITCTAAGRADLADLVDLLRMPPYDFSLRLVQPDSHLEAHFHASQAPRYRAMVGSTGFQALSTRECIDLLTAAATHVPVSLRFQRKASDASLRLLLEHLLADRTERELALQGDDMSDESSNGAARDDASPPEPRPARSQRLVHEAGYRLYNALMLTHPYADGTGRLGNTVLNVHLARSGQGISALHDLSATDGGSIEQGLARIAQGQSLVRSWLKVSADDPC